MSNTTQIEHTATLVVAIILTVVAAEIFLVLPMVLAAAAGDLQLSEQQIGFLAAATMSGAAVSSMLAVFWVRRVNWRLCAGLGLTLLASTLWLAILLHSYASLLVLLTIASIGGGAVYSLAITVLSDRSNSDRAFGFSLTAQVAFQVVGLLVLPHVTKAGGLSAVLAILGVLPVLALLTLRWLPAHGNTVTASRISEVIRQPRAMLALAGCLMFFFNIGVFWAYIERMGNAEGFSAERIGMGLAIGVAVGMLGSLTGSWLGAGLGRLRALILGTLGTLVALALLTKGMSFWVFVVAVGLYNYVWNFSLVYQYSVVTTVDSTGRCLAVAPAFHASGGALGPAVAAFYVSTDSFLAVNLLAAVAVIVSLMLFAPAVLLRAPDTA